MFGFFKNIKLLSAFLGLGLGYSKDRVPYNFLPVVPFAMLLQVVVLYWAELAMPAVLNPILEQQTMGLATVQTASQVAYTLSFLGFMATLTCFPLGHFAARSMRDLPALQAYGWNLIGSLLGSLIFTGVSALGTSPSIWMALAFGAVLWLQREFKRVNLVSALLFLAILGIEGYGPDSVWGQRLRLFSPYQMISVVFDNTDPPGVSIQLHHTAFQKMADISPGKKLDTPGWQKASYY